MIRVKLTLILAIFISQFLFAQANVSRMGFKFGAAGGYGKMFIFNNADNLNLALRQNNFPEIKNGILASAGGGYFYTMFVKNLRFGGFAFSGSNSESIKENSFEKETVINASGGGFTVEYTFSFVKKIGTSIGIMLGGGSTSINLYKNDGNLIWPQNIVSETKINTELTNTYFLITPIINVEIPFSRFIALRAGVGYNIKVNSEWKFDNGKSISNIDNNLDGDNLFLQLGIYVGFFAF